MIRELYINSKLVDVDASTRITLQYKSFLFEGISALQAPRSWTVSLPATVRNLAMIKQSHMSDYDGNYDGNFPYTSCTVDYWVRGFHLIPSGKAILLKVAERIEFVFTWGSINELVKLLNKTKLTELTEESTDWVEWNRSIDYTDVSSGIRWCHWYNYTNEDRSFDPAIEHDDIPKAVSHPVANLKWVLDKIATEFSIEMTSLDDYDVFEKYGFPLRNKNAGTIHLLTFDSDLIANILYPVGFPAYYPRTVFFDPISNGYFYTLNLSSVSEERNYQRFYKKFVYSKSAIKITLDTTSRYKIYFVTSKNSIEIPYTDLGIAYPGLNFKYDFTTTFQLDESEDWFELQIIPNPATVYNDWSSDNYTYLAIGDISFVPVEAVFSISSTNGIANLGFFPIIPNLPDMTCAEFIFQCMQLVGVFPYVDEDDPSTILFHSAAVLADNIASAKDWSKKLVKSTPRMGQLSEVEFTLRNYTQRNILKYKTDELNILDTSGTLTVANTNLEEESNLVELKFAAGKRFSEIDTTIDYPLYDIKIESTVLIRNPITQSNDVLAEIVNVSSVNYLKFTDAMKFSSIVADTEYAAYQGLINKPRLIKEQFYLTAQDVQDIDLRIPVYIEQYGKYYAIIAAQVDEEGLTECELLELKNI